MVHFLTHRNRPIVTTDATADDLVVIDGTGGNGRPGANDVTGLTDIGRGDMRCRLTAGIGAVMAFDTGLARRRAVIKGGDKPVGSSMAGVTGFNRRNVGSTFAFGNHTIVAAFTGANHLRVIDQRINWNPSQGIVAGLAFLTGIDVCGRLTTGTGTVMAANTGGRPNGAVIEGGYQPCRYQMAGITRLRRHHMCSAFALRNSTVVTGFAGTQYLRMIHG